MATITGLIAGGAYEVAVRALAANNVMSDWSDVAMGTATGPGSTPSGRRLTGISPFGVQEGGQVDVTISLNGPVEPGRIFKAKIRLVGQHHTRQAGSVAPLSTPNPHRVVGGVRYPLTGELQNHDYDADVIGELTIQPGHDRGIVTVRTGTDNDAEDERLLLQAIKDGQMFDPTSDVGGGVERVFMVKDSHTRGYVLTAVPDKIYEAGPFTTASVLHFTPNYAREDESVRVTLTSDHPAYSALFANGLNSMLLPAGSGGVTATFQLVPQRRNPPTPTACNCDGNRDDDDVTVTATIGGTATVVGEDVATTKIMVVDVHKLPNITVTARTEDGLGPLDKLTEGSKYKVSVSADRNNPSGEVTSETVRITLARAEGSTAMAEDYRITPSSVSIRGGAVNQTGTFNLEVLGGDGDIDDEMLMLDAMVSAGATNGAGAKKKGELSVTLVDATTLNVEPMSNVEVELAVTKARDESEGPDNLWTEGDDDVSIALGDLFKLPSTGFDISADAKSDDTDVVMASADSTGVTLKAMKPGTAMITVTATAAEMARSASSSQVSPNIATVTFEIMVDRLDLVLMLSGPEDNMNLVEGDMPHANGTPASAMLTVTANQMVAEDIEVMIMRDRSKSSAGEDDYEVGMVTIEADSESGTTMVMAVEDDMPEDMEELVLYAMAGDMEVEGEVMLYLWDAAVPALPIIAQLLLAAFLAAGGYRRYRRR